jgi:hypothetical protein
MSITKKMGTKTSPQGYLCVINEHFLAKSEEYLRMCNVAIQSNKPMYVIVKEGVNWDDFKQFPWRLSLFFETEKEFDEAVKKIRQDLKFFALAGGP